MKKLTLILACVGLFSTAILAQTPSQDGPKTTAKTTKITKAKPLKKVAVLRTNEKLSPAAKVENKKK